MAEAERPRAARDGPASTGATMDGNGSFGSNDGKPRPPQPSPPQRRPVARRRGRTGPTPRRGALLTGLTLVAAALIGVTITMPSGGVAPSGSPDLARATTGPSDGSPAGSDAPATPPGDGSPRTAPEPTVDPAGWAAVDLPAFELTADLAATRTEPGGTSIDTAFVLTSRSGPAAALARHLEVVPPVELAVVPGGTQARVRLVPAVPLAEGTTYRFALRLPDGSLAGSWVFQTGAAPSVARTLPADERTNVPVDTGIEITWDQDGVGDIAPYFSISPKVGGRFERHGRAAVFVPDALQPRTVYTVTVRRGVPLEGSRLAARGGRHLPVRDAGKGRHDESCADVAIVRAAVTPDPATGVFTTSLELAAIPAGQYELTLYVGDRPVTGTYLEVGLIRKPAYRLDLSTNRKVIVAGDRLVATATASFFDGTAAPGVAFVVGHAEDQDYAEDVATGTTGANGANGAGDAVVPVDLCCSQWEWQDPAVSASPG